MGNGKQTIWRLFAVMLLVGALLSPMAVVQLALAAPTYSSTNYGVDEVFMGAGGLNDASSASYRARASLGDTGVYTGSLAPATGNKYLLGTGQGALRVGAPLGGGCRSDQIRTPSDTPRSRRSAGTPAPWSGRRSTPESRAAWCSNGWPTSHSRRWPPARSGGKR